MTTLTYPVAISGAGITGSVLALALVQAGVRVCLIESRPAAENSPGPRGRRPIALSLASVRIFKGLGIWQAMATHATAIRTVQVSERGKFGATRISAEDYTVKALGYVCEARHIEAALGSALAKFKGSDGPLQQLNSTTVSDAKSTDHDVRVHLAVTAGRRDVANPHFIKTQLLVAADGADSTLRDCYQLPILEREYHQVAVVCRLKADKPHLGCAFERFTDQGPVALLPLSENQCALVWSLPREAGEAMAGLADEEFAVQLQQQFGRRLGRLSEFSQRSCFPLKLVRSCEHTGPRFAVVGNAAQQLHPVAGQGLNLGLRDAAWLAELIFVRLGVDGDPGDRELLAQYSAHRHSDQRWVVGLTDVLARGVTPGFARLSALRGLGLLAVDMLPFVKSLLARHTMGLAGYQSRLVRGLPLDGHRVGGLQS